MCIGLMMLSTCSASTERSGSAIVINTPITKQTMSKVLNLPVLESPEPICSPIGVIAISAPRLNNAIPKISATAEHENTTPSVKVKFKRGVALSNSTIAVTGKTETTDSVNFLKSAFSMIAPRVCIFKNEIPVYALNVLFYREAVSGDLVIGFPCFQHC